MLKLKGGICLFLFMACAMAGMAQQHLTANAIRELYQSSLPLERKGRDASAYYLVELNDSSGAYPRMGQVIKRISSRFYIIRSAKTIPVGGELVSALPANSLWKATDDLVQAWKKHPGSKRAVQFIAINGITDTLAIRLRDLPQRLQQNDIIFAALVRMPHEEIAVSGIDLGANSISAIGANFPGIDGSGINVAVKENRYDNDLDLDGRSFSSFLTSTTVSGHATVMATLIGGNGNSFFTGRGAAPKAAFTSSNFARLMPDSTALFHTFRITVQNHSYGTGIENYYGPESVAYDQQVLENDSIVHVFSSGNIGTSAPAAGVYAGLGNYANLSGSFKQAKNVFVIGGTGRNNAPEALSSAGPAYDGRVKPELVADGEDGTSGAAALVSGTVALLQQAYRQQYHHLPSAALLKTVLVNSADDISALAVDYKTGYGKLNALEAMRTISQGRMMEGRAATGEQREFMVTVPPGSAELKITLSWLDVPAPLNAPRALVNDLDLSVTTPAGDMLLPWTLNAYPSKDSLELPAWRRRDTLNTTEQVTLAHPPAGAYSVRVRAGSIANGSQAFSLAYQTTPENHFKWTFPAGNDQLVAAADNTVRWQSSFTGVAGTLSVSYDHGVTWQKIAEADLKGGSYIWASPDLFTLAMLKMDIAGKEYRSGEFSLSRPMELQVGYNCTDGTLLHWSPQPGSKGYTVYTIKDHLLQPLVSSSDTSVIIRAQQQTSPYFAVSANGQGFEGLKSYTIHAANQGVGCYVKTLLAVAGKNEIFISLSLGSVVNIHSITWEKVMGANSYSPVGTTTIGNSLDYTFTDHSPRQGSQTYRAKLTTVDGRIIYSGLAEVVFLQSGQFVIYPNPVVNQLNILSASLEAYELKVYDMAGKLNLSRRITDLQTSIPIALNPGIYFYVIMLNGKPIYRGKLIKV